MVGTFLGEFLTTENDGITTCSSEVMLDVL